MYTPFHKHVKNTLIQKIHLEIPRPCFPNATSYPSIPIRIWDTWIIQIIQVICYNNSCTYINTGVLRPGQSWWFHQVCHQGVHQLHQEGQPAEGSPFLLESSSIYSQRLTVEAGSGAYFTSSLFIFSQAVLHYFHKSFGTVSLPCSCKES